MEWRKRSKREEASGSSRIRSFLAYQRRLDEGQGQSKGQTLFGFDKIPSANHIRARLDPASPDPFPPVFAEVVTALEGSGRLDGLRRLDGHVVIALDGTQYHVSSTVHGPHGSQRTRGKDKMEYSMRCCRANAECKQRPGSIVLSDRALGSPDVEGEACTA
jgi:hypothetical protein